MMALLLAIPVMASAAVQPNEYEWESVELPIGEAEFDFLPRDMAVDDGGNIYAADYDNSCIQVFDNHGTFLYMFSSEGGDDGESIPPGYCTRQ